MTNYSRSTIQKNFNDVGSVNGAHGDWRRCWWQSGLMWGAKKARKMLPACLGGVVLPRFELGQAEPKSAVLPLHHKTISVPKSFPPFGAAKLLLFFEAAKYFGSKNKIIPKNFCVPNILIKFAHFSPLCRHIARQGVVNLIT